MFAPYAKDPQDLVEAMLADLPAVSFDSELVVGDRNCLYMFCWDAVHHCTSQPIVLLSCLFSALAVK